MVDWTLETLAESYRRIGFKAVSIATGAPPAGTDIWVQPDQVVALDGVDQQLATVSRRFGSTWIELGRVPYLSDPTERPGARGTRGERVGDQVSQSAGQLAFEGLASTEGGATGQLQIGARSRVDARTRSAARRRS